MHLQFQSPFDDAAYRKAKGKGEGANHNKTASKTKPNHSRRRAIKLTTPPSCTVGMDIDEEFPPIETLLESPTEVYDLTAEQEPLAGQPESICQQPTPEINDDSNRGREAVIHDISTERGERHLSRQGRSPNDGGRLTNGADTVEHSGRDDRQESVDSISAHNPRPSAQSSNGAAGLPEDARSNAVSTCLESGGTEAPEVSLCSSASSQHARKHEPSNAPSSCRQAPSSQLTVSDGDGHPESLGVRGETLSGGDDDVPPGEWEAAEIIGEEVQDGVQHYVVVWKPTLEPEEHLGHMKDLIEEWKAKVQALGEKERSGFGIKKPGTGGKSRIKKGRAGSGGAKRGRRSRPRKL